MKALFTTIILAFALSATISWAKLPAADVQVSIEPEAILAVLTAETEAERQEAQIIFANALLAKCAAGRAAGTLDPLCVSIWMTLQ